jgi:hypothetical protein
MNPKRLMLRIGSGAVQSISFADLTQLLAALGFELQRIEGSHHIFARPDIREQPNLQPCRDGQAKPYQVRQVKRLVAKYDLKLKEE